MQDVDDAVAAARHAFENTWGMQVSSQSRGQLLYKLAEEMEKISEELAGLESLDSGKPLACECRRLLDLRGGVITDHR